VSKPPRLRCLKPSLPTLASPLVKARTGNSLWRPDSERGTAAQRGYGAEWRRLRAVILKRDEGLCQACLRAGRTTVATQVDHVIPKAAGGTDDPSNLRALCRPCHEEKSRREMRDPLGGEG
jgi:5-methylcytosine-specific restriction endonuclease McrA